MNKSSISPSSDADLSDFFYHSLDLMCIAGHDGYFKKVNPAFVKTLGYSFEELTSRPYLDFVLPEDLQKTQGEAQQLVDGEGSLRFENRYRCKDGSVVWLSWKSIVVGNRIIATARNKTQQKLIEFALQEREQQLELLLSRAPLTLFAVDNKGILKFSVGKGLDIAGIKVDEIIGVNLLERHKNEPLICEPLKEALAGQRTTTTVRIRELDYEIHFEPIADDSGKVVQVLGLSIIIADQKRRETERMLEVVQKALKETSDIKFALDQSSIVATTDAEGKIIYANQKFCEISKYTYEEIIGRDHRIINSKYHPKSFFKTLWQTISSGRVWSGEIKNRAKDGSEYWMSTFIVPFLDTEQKPYQYISIHNDITQRKQAEDESSRLRLSERAAHEASELKSQFLANMSHEIRTPLNGVVGMSQLLLQTQLGENQREYVELVMRSAEHLSQVVNDILDLSKIESNHLQLDRTDVNIGDLIRNVQASLKFSAQAKNLRLEAAIDSEIDLFFGDSLRLRQVLINLVQNAIKFTDTGEVKVTVSKTPTSLRFEVQDSGVGIPPEVSDIIFKPFTQADNSVTRRFGGTGLGLSICKRLVGLMGGDLQVKSRVGIGSVFFFELPLTVQIQKIESTEQATEMPALPPLKILVAEDHPINQKVILRILENAGHRAEVVADGESVLRHIERNYFDLILMDCHMPVQDGFTTTVKIREGKQPVSQIPIIALTADALNDTKSKCFAVGMNGYVSKPIDVCTLFSEIKQAIVKDIPALKRVSLARLKNLNKLGCKDFAIELMEDFISKSPGEIQRIENAFKTEDWPQLIEIVHPLKSASGALGATNLERACLHLENLSLSDKKVLALATAQVIDAHREAIELFHDYLKKYGEPLNASTASFQNEIHNG